MSDSLGTCRFSPVPGASPPAASPLQPWRMVHGFRERRIEYQAELSRKMLPWQCGNHRRTRRWNDSLGRWRRAHPGDKSFSGRDTDLHSHGAGDFLGGGVGMENSAGGGGAFPAGSGGDIANQGDDVGEMGERGEPRVPAHPRPFPFLAAGMEGELVCLPPIGRPSDAEGDSCHGAGLPSLPLLPLPAPCQGPESIRMGAPLPGGTPPGPASGSPPMDS